jgi:hypothetical protein
MNLELDVSEVILEFLLADLAIIGIGGINFEFFR